MPIDDTGVRTWLEARVARVDQDHWVSTDALYMDFHSWARSHNADGSEQPNNGIAPTIEVPTIGQFTRVLKQLGHPAANLIAGRRGLRIIGG